VVLQTIKVAARNLSGASKLLAKNHIIIQQDWTRVITLRLEIGVHHRVSSILSKISDNDTSTETRQKGKIVQDPSGWLMVHWTLA
jgi:hypothetical protein